MSKTKINPHDNVLALCYLAAIITAIIVGFATDWSAWFLVCIMFCPALFRLVVLCVSKRYRTWCKEQEEQERAEAIRLKEQMDEDLKHIKLTKDDYKTTIHLGPFDSPPPPYSILHEFYKYVED